MKSSSQPPRTPSRLSDSAHHQLNMYALAASAAGVGMLALGQPAEAKVVYTSTHKWLPVNQYFYIDLNHDGVKDFGFHLVSLHRSSFSSCKLSVEAASQSKNEIYSTLWGEDPMAAALPKGTKVGPEHGFQNQLHYAVMFADGSSIGGNWYFGPWFDPRNQAYLGVRFLIKGKVHYGWARLGHIRGQTGPAGGWCYKPTALLTGYAYETIPNKPIITGQTKGPDVITLESDSLGQLAQGALGGHRRILQPKH